MSCIATFRLAAVCGLASFGMAEGLQADTAVLTPAEDATISEKDPGQLDETKLEVSTNGHLEDSRALLRFDLAGSVPTNAIITAAALTIELKNTAPEVTSLWIDLHKVVRAWSETAVSWTNRLTPPAPWSAPGGAAPADFVGLVTQSNRITTTLGPYTFGSSPPMVADVQDWVRNPVSNWGWMMISELEGVARTVLKFSSREGSDPPSLVVQYTVPPARPTLRPLSMAAGEFRFSFEAESNRNYAVEYNATPAAGGWSVLTNIAPWPAPTNVVVSDALTESNRFYRVRTP